MSNVPAATVVQAGEVEPAGGGAGLLVGGLILTVAVAGLWKLFEKAGRPGWASLVPFYNIFVLMKIANRPMWWFALLLIPVVNLVAWFVINLNVAWRFGKDLGYAFGLTIVPFVVYPLLGFGSAVYRPGRGPSGGRSLPRA